MIVDVYENGRMADKDFEFYAPVMKKLAKMGLENSRQYFEAVAHDVKRMLFR